AKGARRRRAFAWTPLAVVREIFGVGLQEKPGDEFFRRLQIRGCRLALPKLLKNPLPARGAPRAQFMGRARQRGRRDLFERGDEARKTRQKNESIEFVPQRAGAPLPLIVSAFCFDFRVKRFLKSGEALIEAQAFGGKRVRRS